MCCISKYVWTKKYIFTELKNIYMSTEKYICGLKNIFVKKNIYLWTKKNICGLKNIFLV